MTKLSSKLDKAASTVAANMTSKNLLKIVTPVLRGNKIIVGEYAIIKKDGAFDVYRNNRLLYANIISKDGLFSIFERVVRNTRRYEISEILKLDIEHVKLNNDLVFLNKKMASLVKDADREIRLHRIEYIMQKLENVDDQLSSYRLTI